MEKRDIEAYKKELMKLYSKGCPEDTDTSAPDSIGCEENVPETAEPAEDICPDDENDVISENTEVERKEEEIKDDAGYPQEEGDDCFPIPDEGTDIQDSFNEDEEFFSPTIVQEESMGSSTGSVIVNVRTGNEASPIEDASVMVTAVSNGKRLFIAAGATDISGILEISGVPAPDREFSLHPDSSVRPYSLYDISVHADGFFNARSVDVPVFPGITSVQNFNMIPLPLGAAGDEDTLTYFNQEPDLKE